MIERTLDLPWGRMAALGRGDSGPRVLALHGWLDNAGSFGPMLPHLEGLELVCLDLAGHGLSDPRPPGTRYHFDDYVFDVLAAADALDWERFHLLGHSLGGAVATVTAAAAPKRVASLALIEGLGPLSAPGRHCPRAWRKAVAASRTRPRRVHASAEAAIAARAANTDLTEAEARVLAERGLEETGEGFQWRHDLRLTWPTAHRYTEPEVLALIGAIECPVLNLYAEPASWAVDDGRMGRRLAALRRPAGVHRIAGGHHLHMKKPEDVARLVLEHVNEHEQAEP